MVVESGKEELLDVPFDCLAGTTDNPRDRGRNALLSIDSTARTTTTTATILLEDSATE